MARICPQCSQIHFETSTEPLPTKCSRCEADLNGFGASIVPVNDVSAAKSDPLAPQTGKLQFLIGFALLAACGGLIWYGLKLYNESIETTALVVKYNKSMSTPPGTNRADNIAFFMIGGTRIYTYPGVRADGESFKVYYPPSKPESASESRPFILFVVAGLFGLIGGAMTFIGLFRYFLSRAQYKDFNRTLRITQG
jgi:hypothetical protein